jgi:hypothetical protein
MVAKGIIRLTTNKEFDRFTKSLADAGVETGARARDRLEPESYRRKTVEIMGRLNPGRVFVIAIPRERVIRHWFEVLGGLGDGALDSGDVRIEAANAILPGRTNLYRLDGRLRAELRKAAALARSVKTWSDKRFVAQSLKFLELATRGHYPVVDDRVTAIEFTTVYPAATAMAWTPYKELKLPDFGVTGAWPLIPRSQGRGLSGEVDYISPSPGYGYIPLLAYQHAGGVYYNALEGPGVRMPLNATPFLPEAWVKVRQGLDPTKTYRNLWLGSRGPTSRGSTRLPAGHMSELRDVLPSSSTDLEKIVEFRNLPQCFDLFDIDGDGSPEVVGLQYHIAYWIDRNRPREPYAANNRKAFYTWLYKDNVYFKKNGRAFLKEVPLCRFTGLRKAAEVGIINDVAVYDAPYAREAIQFYLTEPVRFSSRQGVELNRELRRIGAGHDLDRRKLLLDVGCCNRSEPPG